MRIGLIANNERTVADLLHYFAHIGVRARLLSISGEWLDAPADAGESEQALQAIVIFPDDFEEELVDRLFDRLGHSAKTLLQLVVTRQPQRFLSTSFSKEAPPPRSILSRPTFGWRLLDAIRAHLDSENPAD